MPELKDINLEQISTRSGVYLMYDEGQRVIYVGKARNLRARVRQYVRGDDKRAQIQFLMQKARFLETVITDTEKEALILENTLIKKHKPRYNINLRDDKTYISLRLDIEHEWPRVHRVRRRGAVKDKALYFGPYSSSGSVKETLRFLQRLFPLRSCPDHVL
ncbi:MAG: GIY-YIG nuclease family protein, partial [Thermodesulfobacteriota bacterium]